MLDSCKWSKNSLKHSIRFCAIFFSNLKHNFIAYRSSKVSSRPDFIFKIPQLWQSGFCRVHSNYWLKSSLADQDFFIKNVQMKTPIHTKPGPHEHKHIYMCMIKYMHIRMFHYYSFHLSSLDLTIFLLTSLLGKCRNHLIPLVRCSIIVHLFFYKANIDTT